MCTPGIDRSAFDILLQDSYSPTELARLLDIDPFVIRHSVRSGDLKAITYDHHILSIRRADALDWLARASLTGALPVSQPEPERPSMVERGEARLRP
jgi:hypothetical protein